MKALKHGLIGWVCVLALAACAEALPSQRIQIEKAEQMLQQNAEEAIALLRSVKDPEILPDSLRARFALAMGQAHYNAHWVMNEDSLLLYALDYYGRPDVRDTLQLLRTYKLAAHYFYDSERYKEATEMMAEGNRIAALRGDTAARLDLLRSVANIGEGNDDFEGLIRLQKQLIAIEPDSTRRYSNYNSLAISYYCANQNDSALLALRKATECLYTSADSLKALYYVMRNYADILSDSGKNQEAINLQRHSLQEYKETKHPFESLSYYALSRYFLNMGQVDSARYYIQMGDSVRSPYIDQDLSLANFYLVQKTLMNYIDSRSFTIRDVAFKKMLLQQLGLIRIVATNPSSDHQELLVQMGRIANKDVAVDDLLVWSDLYKTIDMVHDGFYTRISQKYGNILNEKELQLCCLLKSDFSTKEISVVIQQSIRTVYQRKTVIRQKLDMAEKEDIVEFLSCKQIGR